jgi:hypothetical protein
MRSSVLAVVLVASCTSPRDQGDHVSGTGGVAGALPGTGGIAGTAGPATGGAGGSPVDASGAVGAGGTAGGPVDASGAPIDAAPAAIDGPAADGPPAAPPIDYGVVGKSPVVPLQYTGAPVPPIVAPECPEDPTAGFTEYTGEFLVQRPYDLAASDRFKYDGGIYTFWVQSTDNAYLAGGSVGPRSEAHFASFAAGERLWSSDVLVETPSRTAIFQVHATTAEIALYLRVVSDRLFDLTSGQTILTPSTGKWFNLKVAFNAATHESKTYINNCLRQTATPTFPTSPTGWYFASGVQICDTGTCRSSFKNIHLYQR